MQNENERNWLFQSPELTPSKSDNEYRKLREQYFDAESITPTEMERWLLIGELRNIHLIEDFVQPVGLHADRALLGQLSKHKDVVLEAELVLPDQEKPMLVVYKPNSGVNNGTDPAGKSIWLPASASSHAQKDAAAWIFLKRINFSQLSVPTIFREDLVEGPGSLRPYIWGKPVDSLTADLQDTIYDDEQLMEDIAFVDYLLQTMDRREPNMIWTDSLPGELKLIDHTLTFLDEDYSNQFTIKGPRLLVAYDNLKDILRRRPIPDRLIKVLEQLVDQRDDFTNELLGSGLLNEGELISFYNRVNKMRQMGIFI